MQAERSAILVHDLHEEPHPRTYFDTIAPTAIRREWVPQTAGESIWMLFEFADERARSEWIDSLSSEMLARCRLQAQPFFDHWTGGGNSLEGWMWTKPDREVDLK